MNQAAYNYHSILHKGIYLFNQLSLCANYQSLRKWDPNYTVNPHYYCVQRKYDQQSITQPWIQKFYFNSAISAEDGPSLHAETLDEQCTTPLISSNFFVLNEGMITNYFHYQYKNEFSIFQPPELRQLLTFIHTDYNIRSYYKGQPCRSLIFKRPV